MANLTPEALVCRSFNYLIYTLGVLIPLKGSWEPYYKVPSRMPEMFKTLKILNIK